MGAGDPIRLGSANTATLVPQTASQITTDEFGIQRGQVRYSLGDQSISQSVRVGAGTSYFGSLAQFVGFFVSESGNITGGEGKTAMIDIGYARIDPLWSNLPHRSNDLQLVNILPADTGAYGQLYETFSQVIVPISHPVITYKYSAATDPANLGTYGNPTGAPTLSTYTFHIQTHDFSSTQLIIEQKTFTIATTLITFDVNGNCVRTTVNVTATARGIFSQSDIGLINPLNLNFVPDPLGWFCDKEEVQPVAAGHLFAVEQRWKRNYLFSGMSAGTWWQGGHQIHC